MVGKTISHYRILEKLGLGGMGVVYKAEDTKLKRQVALKFLSASVLDDEQVKARFLHEARAAAALDHPNICGIYEIDEFDGGTFMVMPFLEGQSLDKRIAGGPLPIPLVVEIARQAADALQEALSKGIVHRDIKPANLMLRSACGPKPRVTLMDFGLARLSQASKLTREGSQLGTAPYMSPEQVEGAEVDQRTDIWSLGVVMYEMTLGQMQFAAEYEQALFYGILHEQPEPLTARRSGVPMELERVVNKCMAKEPEARYQSATDLLVDLRALLKTFEDAGKSRVRSTAPVESAAREQFDLKRLHRVSTQ